MLEHIIVIDIGTLEVKKCFQSKYSWHVIQFELMFASRVHSVSKTNHNFFGTGKDKERKGVGG